MSPSPTTFKCPECQALLDVVVGALVVKCKYCGASVKVARTLSRPAPPSDEPQPVPVERSPLRYVALLPAVLSVGIAVWVLSSKSTVPKLVAPLAPLLGAGQLVQWDPAANQPAWAGRIDDDGVEDLLGGYRILDPQGGGNHFVAGY